MLELRQKSTPCDWAARVTQIHHTHWRHTKTIKGFCLVSQERTRSVWFCAQTVVLLSGRPHRDLKESVRGSLYSCHRLCTSINNLSETTRQKQHRHTQSKRLCSRQSEWTIREGSYALTIIMMVIITITTTTMIVMGISYHKVLPWGEKRDFTYFVTWDFSS